ncbi:hypothetical protein D3C80_1420990 [compost metagenome]
MAKQRGSIAQGIQRGVEISADIADLLLGDGIHRNLGERLGRCLAGVIDQQHGRQVDQQYQWQNRAQQFVLHRQAGQHGSPRPWIAGQPLGGMVCRTHKNAVTGTA